MRKCRNEYRITLNTRCGIGRAFVVIDRSILELVSQLLRRSLIVEDLLRDILQSNEHALWIWSWYYVGNRMNTNRSTRIRYIVWDCSSKDTEVQAWWASDRRPSPNESVDATPQTEDSSSASNKGESNRCHQRGCILPDSHDNSRYRPWGNLALSTDTSCYFREWCSCYGTSRYLCRYLLVTKGTKNHLCDPRRTGGTWKRDYRSRTDPTGDTQRRRNPLRWRRW